MSLSGTIAFIRLLIGVRNLIDSIIKMQLASKNAEDRKAIEAAVIEYQKGATVEDKSKAAEKVRDLFRNR